MHPLCAVLAQGVALEHFGLGFRVFGLGLRVFGLGLRVFGLGLHRFGLGLRRFGLPRCNLLVWGSGPCASTRSSWGTDGLAKGRARVRGTLLNCRNMP